MKLARKTRYGMGGRRSFALAVAALLASVACAPSAWAEGGGIAEGQTGSGETSLVLRLNDMRERGGVGAAGEYENPDADGDGLGDILAFTVPIRLDFAVLANGQLVGPSGEACYVKNESRYPVRVSALDIDEKNGWHIVADADASFESNAIDLQLGPSADMLDAVDYLEKNDVGKPGEWNMAAKAPSGTQDRIELVASGNVGNITANVNGDMAFGQIHWYMTPGVAA